MIPILWGLAACLYGTSIFFFLLQIWYDQKFLEKLGLTLAILGALSQSLAILMEWIALKHFPVLNIHEALGTFAVLMIGFFLVFQWKWRLRGFGFFSSALAFLSTLISYAYPSAVLNAPTPELSGALLAVHVTIILASFGLFGLAFSTSISYLIQDYLLHKKHSIKLSKKLPSLLLLDSITNHLVTIGFILLTIGMALGSIWANRWWGSWWNWNPKEKLALFTWIIYAIYIHARTLTGEKGKKLAVLIIAGFALVIFTFLASNLLPGSVHP